MRDKLRISSENIHLDDNNNNNNTKQHNLEEESKESKWKKPIVVYVWN